MAISRDVLYDPDPDGQGSGSGGSDGGTDTADSAAAQDSTNSPDQAETPAP